MLIMSTAGKEKNVFGRIPSINEMMLLRGRRNCFFGGVSARSASGVCFKDVVGMLASGTEGYRIVT